MRKTQRGFTLTGLMISIALVQVVVLVSLKLQAAHHSTIEDIRITSAHDRALATALTISLKELRGAGYGIVGATQADILVQNKLETPTSPFQRAIYWRFQGRNGFANCRGLVDRGVTIDGKEFRQLDFIRSPGGCNFSDALNTFPWDLVIGTLGTWEIDDLLETHLATNGSLFNFVVDPSGTCGEARLANAQPHLVVTVSAPNTAELNGNNVPSNNHDVCLLNI